MLKIVPLFQEDVYPEKVLGTTECSLTTCFASCHLPDRRRDGHTNCLENLPAGPKVFTSDGKRLAPVFDSDLLQSFEILIDLGPLETMTGLFQPAIQLLPEGHRPEKVMQEKGVDAVDHIIPMPAVTGAVRYGDEEPMQNSQEDRPFDVETKLSLCQKTADDFTHLKFFLKSLTDQRWTDLLGIHMNVALPGKD